MVYIWPLTQEWVLAQDTSYGIPYISGDGDKSSWYGVSMLYEAKQINMNTIAMI